MSEGGPERPEPERGSIGNRFAALVVDHSRPLLAALLVFSLVLGGGVLALDVETGFLEVDDLPEQDALRYAEENFTTEPGSGSVLVVVEGEDAISRDAARRQVATQQRFKADDRVETDPNDPPVSFANAVAAYVAYQIDSGSDDVDEAALENRRRMLEAGNLTYGPDGRTHPPLERQASILAAIDDDEYAAARRTVVQGGGDAFLPVSYESGPANATIMVVPLADGSLDPASHGAVQTTADEELRGEVRAFSGALHAIELQQAIADSLLLVGPLAVLFVVTVLWVAYRDLVDVVLGVLGVALVLVWMFGFMGWAGITFNQVFVAAPILVVGLSIDYMYHVSMRYRERFEPVEGTAADLDRVRAAMRSGLAGVGIALAVVTATTVLGFLANVTSPVPTIREFGVVGAAAIVSVFVVFTVLVPAARLEVDRLLAARRSRRVRAPLGTGGRLGRLLSVPARAAWDAPRLVVGVAVATGLASVYAATLLSPTAFTTFLPRDPSPWLYALPEPFAPGEYHFLTTADDLQTTFGYGGREGHVLVRGDVASAAALKRVANGSRRAADSPLAAQGSATDPAVRTPLTVMRDVAAENESFNETYTAADVTGDGVPDRNVRALYEELFRVAPDRAGSVVHRADGEYRALLVTVSVRSGVRNDQMAAELDGIAAATDGGNVTAVPASNSNVMAAAIQDIVDGIVVAIGTALSVVAVFVTGVFAVRHRSAALGVLTVLPMTIAVAWLFGTMYLLGLPLNEVTGLIATFTIALGIDYTIHVTERFRVEAAAAPAETALVRTLRGSGGALLGSALTTGGAFAILLLSVFPPLRLFGAMMALTMTYAFVSSVIVLPALLALWSGRRR